MVQIFNSIKDRYKSLTIILAIFLFLIAILYLLHPFYEAYSDPGAIKDIVKESGFLAPLFFVIIQIVKVFFVIVPGQITALAAGYLFGPIIGTIYTLIGSLIGTLIAILLTRKFGRPFVEKAIDKKALEKFDERSEKNGLIFMFIIYLLPGLPDDAMSFLAGLTDIPIHKLLFISALGRLPGFFVLNLIGYGISEDRFIFTGILIFLAVAIAAVVYLHRQRIEFSIRNR